MANVLKRKACSKVKFKCVSVTMYSLLMSPFSHDFIKTNQSINCALIIESVQYSHSAWFSVLVCREIAMVL